MCKTMIGITTSFEGIHNYPEAPDEVSFLRNEHRHTFGVIVEVEVFNDDREIEFIRLKRRLEHWMMCEFKVCGNALSLGRMSCEQMAKKIGKQTYETIAEMVGGLDPFATRRSTKVRVDEDGENYAIVESGGMYGFDFE